MEKENNNNAVRVKVHCSICGWKTEYFNRLNEHGFFHILDAYCPIDGSLMNQEIDIEAWNDYKRRSSECSETG